MKELITRIGKAFLEGYATGDLDIGTMFLCIAVSTAMGAYIFLVYRLMKRKSFYNFGFNMSLVAMAVITSAIILTIQSNIVVSLGMVGALSIVRFRTAVKDPMDLVFLFWAISVGIICGAGFAMIAVIASVALTVVLLFVNVVRSDRGSQVLVVNADEDIEAEAGAVLDEHCRSWKVRARNASKAGVHLAVEVRTHAPHDLVREMMKLPHVSAVSLVEHDGEITA